MSVRLPLWKRFWRAEDGATAIEAAIIFPVGFLVLFGMVEFSLMFYSYAALNNVVKEIAARASQECPAEDRTASGACANPNALVQPNEIKSLLQSFAFGLVEADKLCISAAPVNLATTGTYTGTPNQVNFGGSDEVVRMNFHYSWGFFTPMIRAFFTDESVDFNARFLVRNGTIANSAGRNFQWESTDNDC